MYAKSAAHRSVKRLQKLALNTQERPATAVLRCRTELDKKSQRVKFALNALVAECPHPNTYRLESCNEATLHTACFGPSPLHQV